MKRPIALALAAGGILAVALAVTWPGDGPPLYQGWIEADTVFVGAEDGGRIDTLAVQEGSTVAAGAALFTLDARTQAADVQAARQALDEAQARVARIESAQQRPEEIAILEASLQRATASYDYAKSDLARAQELLRRGIATQARVDQAQSAADQAKAAVDEVKRQIDAGHLTGRREDVEAARFVVGQAEARLTSARARLERVSVKAPEAGSILEVYYRPGEVVPAGRPVVALLPPGNMKVRFFVPQAMLPKLTIGDVVRITCDGCRPGLEASLSYLSQQAEFTPPVIYSLEERRKLIYRVEARPTDPSAFRVGQPVAVDLTRAEQRRGR